MDQKLTKMYSDSNYCKITLSTFHDNLKLMLHEMSNDVSSKDVTLVCDDKVSFKAHRFVLSTFSVVFKEILKDKSKTDF